MAIQQVSSNGSNGIMSFLFSDDGGVEGAVLEGAEFAKTLHQLLGDYEEGEVPADGDSENPLAATLSVNGEIIEVTTPLSAELETLTSDFTLPEHGAELSAEAGHEAAEGQELPQPFWRFAPFTDVSARTQRAAATPLDAHSTTAAAATSATTTEEHALLPTPAASGKPSQDCTTALVIAIDELAQQHIDALRHPAADAAPSTSAAHDAPALPAAFGNGITHLVELARDAQEISTQLLQPAPVPAPLPTAVAGRTAPTSGKLLPQAFRPLTLASQTLSGAQTSAPQTTTAADALPAATPEGFGALINGGLTPEPVVTESAQNPASSTPASAHTLQGLRTDAPLPHMARALAAETAASGNATQLQSNYLAGTEAWFDDLGTQVEWLKDMNIEKADLQLHPAELGLLEIQINTGDEGTSVSFVTHNAAARELIEESMPRLRDLLSSQGLQLGQSQVSQHSEGQRRQQDPGNSALGAEQQGAAEDSAPVRRRAYVADPNRIDHYV